MSDGWAAGELAVTNRQQFEAECLVAQPVIGSVGV
jgi:hypothetical protein